MSHPSAILSPLPKADGSATFSSGGFTVLAAVNGPLEAPRRDEDAFEALVEVMIRPAAGPGGPAERLVETMLQSALRQIIPLRDFPRTMVQLTLQILEQPQTSRLLHSPKANLALVPALLHASILGLLSAAVPLKAVAVAVTLAVKADRGIVVEPTPADVGSCRSLHAVAFTSDDELLLAESTGSFSVAEWQSVLETGQSVCCRDASPDTSISADVPESQGIRTFIRCMAEAKSDEELHWK
ncbi:ribosomal protein S5 domain 2-type fold domain containing protein [Ophiocordyceps camponoti-floridani]|uniref:Ribosomal protein S5 domain 2-type fold domain containing protein n=1 Tax=Ophiocordyceps camponoti-floridani TaxID=2030778 RepID=A0A8H4Q153_9HYPO|nr:ribosomal protein S5 domain 2-type fold domain containing protein [Ophiocordyceps camponoti-floridani]